MQGKSSMALAIVVLALALAGLVFVCTVRGFALHVAAFRASRALARSAVAIGGPLGALAPEAATAAVGAVARTPVAVEPAVGSQALFERADL